MTSSASRRRRWADSGCSSCCRLPAGSLQWSCQLELAESESTWPGRLKSAGLHRVERERQHADARAERKRARCRPPANGFARLPSPVARPVQVGGVEKPGRNGADHEPHAAGRCRSSRRRLRMDDVREPGRRRACPVPRRLFRTSSYTSKAVRSVSGCRSPLSARCRAVPDPLLSQTWHQQASRVRARAHRSLLEPASAALHPPLGLTSDAGGAPAQSGESIALHGRPQDPAYKRETRASSASAGLPLARGDGAVEALAALVAVRFTKASNSVSSKRLHMPT